MTISRKRICLLGEVMIELSDLNFAAQQARIGMAGDTFNTAVHLARLLRGSDWNVEYVTLLGQDSLSDQIIEVMQAEGLGTRLVGRHPDRLPGVYAIERDAKGERSFRYWRSNSAARRLFSEGAPELFALDGAQTVVLSLITLAILPPEIRRALITKLADMRRQGCLVVFDSNYRPALWASAEEARQVSAQMWEATSIALPSRDDEARLWSDEKPTDVVARLAAAGVGEIALKDGAAGPLLWQGEALPAMAFATATRVVDTSAAGDALNAGYLAARLQGLGPADAAKKGHDLAIRVIGLVGALPAPP